MADQKVLVIGGGAAGLLAAGRAAELGANVVLLEKNKMVGRKLLITGKGRCNVTNAGDINKFIENFSGNGRFLFSAFSKFFNQELEDLLKAQGVALKVERGGRIFPVSDKAADIVKALQNYAVKNGALIQLNKNITGLVVEEGQLIGVKTADDFLPAQRVIVATGGKSYPGTGSTGDGYLWAKEVGHSVVPPRPALVPLNTRESWVKDIQGLALKNVEVSLYKGEKLLGQEFGEMLFTHFGVSGPIILTLSRYVVSSTGLELTLYINLKPALSEEKLDLRLQRDFQKYQRKQLKNALDDLLPKNLIPIVIEQSGVSPEKFVHQITKQERMDLLKTLQALKLTVSGPRSLAEAIVTAGGVSLKEVDPRTMESKLLPGLYFAGEVLDIDGFTGGYNLQAAFSTGYVAGESAATK
ncbi:MAG: NAD(P)/FAD-dependent oxidoreductase [Peptococcia bacterium]